jgi:hypothetical protein
MESDLTWDEKSKRAQNAEEMLNGRMAMLSETGQFAVKFMFKQLEVKLEQIYLHQFYLKKYQRQLSELELKLSKHVQAYCIAVFFLWLLHQLLKVDSALNIHIFAAGVALALPVTIHFLKLIGEISHAKNGIKQTLDSKESITTLIDVEFGEFNIDSLIKDNIEDMTKNEGIPLNKYWEEHMGRELIANIKHRIAEQVWLQS